MPISARGRSTKQGSGPPFWHIEWSPPLKEKYKGHTRHELPNTTANAQVTNRLLAAHSPEYSVPLMAAVTFIGIPGWVLISNISAVVNIAMIRNSA